MTNRGHRNRTAAKGSDPANTRALAKQYLLSSLEELNSIILCSGSLREGGFGPIGEGLKSDLKKFSSAAKDFTKFLKRVGDVPIEDVSSIDKESTQLELRTRLDSIRNFPQVFLEEASDADAGEAAPELVPTLKRLRSAAYNLSEYAVNLVELASRSHEGNGDTEYHAFISYCHEDREWVDRLLRMLKPYTRKHKLLLWEDTKIQAGEDWQEEIRLALSKATIAILLVSDFFLESDFIFEHELPPLLNAAKKRGLTVIWALLTACLYDDSDLEAFKAAHNLNQPLDSLPRPEQQKILVEICNQIKAAFRMRRSPTSSSRSSLQSIKNQRNS